MVKVPKVQHGVATVAVPHAVATVAEGEVEADVASSEVVEVRSAVEAVVSGLHPPHLPCLGLCF